jgi:hypothetical protein
MLTATRIVSGQLLAALKASSSTHPPISSISPISSASDQLPFLRWMLGSIFLLIIASIFAAATRRITLHHQAYRKQLYDMSPSYSGITETLPVATNRFLNKTPSLLFFAIPALDMFVWTLFYTGEKFQISFLIPW